MPRQTLEYARELYRDRNELYKELKWEEMLEKEQEFVTLCKELAENKAMILSLPMFLKTEKKKSLEDEDVWMIGYYIILLSKDDDAFSKMKSYGGAIRMLDEEGQKYMIEKYIQMNKTIGVSYLIENNNYIQYVDVIIKLLEDEEDIQEKYDYYCMLINLHQQQYYKEAIEAFLSTPIDMTQLQELKTASSLLEAPIVDTKPKTEDLQEFFKNTIELKERNKTILQAIKQGYSQHMIAKVLGVSR